MATKLRYELRPTKWVERQMIGDALRRLDAFAPLKTYRYVGFGALEFLDFRVMHRSLGVEDMVSIEKDSRSKARYEFNKPYGTIELCMGAASDVLPTLDWVGRCIVWLDYEQHLDNIVIRDCQTVARNLSDGGVLLATFCAQPAPEHERADTLTERVGADRVPGGLTEAKLGRRFLPVVQRNILSEALVGVVKARSPSMQIHQIFSFVYADNAQMQTLGWVITEPASRAYESCRFGEVGYVRDGEEPFRLAVPVLTSKEVGHLNRKLPLREGQRLTEDWLDESDLEDYANSYRWYPEVRSLA